jgi:hypothetical protein
MPSAAFIDFLEEAFLVNLPKRVRIRNLRLGLLLLFLRLIAVAWIVFLLYQGRPWQTAYIPTGSFAFWADAPKQYAEEPTPDEHAVCDPSAIDQYSYQYGADSNYKYTNISCINILPGARYTKGESELFVPTFFEETVSATQSAPSSGGICTTSSCAGLATCDGGTYAPLGVNELGNCICTCSSVRNRFVRGVTKLNLSFEHAASVQWHADDEQTVHSQVKSDRLKTIVRHPTTKEELVSFNPGEPVTLPMSQLLELAHVSLQQQVLTTKANGLQGEAGFLSVNPFPIARMTGMVLQVRLLYHNQDDRGHGTAHDGPVCYVELEPELTWASRPRLDFGQPVDVVTGEGTLRYRYYYGIRIKFSAAGSFSTFDIWKLAMYLVACAVYMQVPGTVVDIIVTYCLGTLSKIYRCVTLPVVTTTALISGMVARSLAAKAAFEGLLRKQMELDEAPSDCRSRRTVDPSSLDVMIQELLAHKEVGEVSKDLSQADMCSIRNQLIGGTAKSDLDEGNFISAITNSEGDGEAVTFRLLSKWFSGSRKEGPLEQIFDNTRAQRNRLRTDRSASNTDLRQIVPLSTDGDGQAKASSAERG